MKPAEMDGVWRKRRIITKHGNDRDGCPKIVGTAKTYIIYKKKK